MCLTNKQLDFIIASADKTYDSVTSESANYDLYHDICAEVAFNEYGITGDDYCEEDIDDRCIKLGQLELDRIM